MNARRGISVRDPRGLLPLRPEMRLALVDCLLSHSATVDSAMLQQVFPQAAYLALEPEWSEADEECSLALAQQSEAILLITRNAGFIPRQAGLAERLATLGVPLIVAAVRNPALGSLEMLDAAIMRTYGEPPVSLRALLEACRYGK